MNSAEAIAALIAIGLNPTLAGSMVAHWAAEKAARLVSVAGKMVSRTEAVILREKVLATREQVIKKLMPIEAARQALQSYGLPDANINALLAEWAAQALKTVLPP